MGKRKILDCFPFFNEWDIVELRLNSVDADYHIIQIADMTYQGEEIPDEVINEKYNRLKSLKKNVVVGITKFQHREKNQDWDRDDYQHNDIRNTINLVGAASDDWVIISDCDEIPIIPSILPDDQICTLEMEMFYFNLSRVSTYKWNHAKIGRWELFTDPLIQIRNAGHAHVIKPGGWHFSYFGGPDFIREKVKSFAHREFRQYHTASDEQLQASINGGCLFDGRSLSLVPFNNLDSLPKYLADNLQTKYRHWL